jgi:hypothetical protein
MQVPWAHGSSHFAESKLGVLVVGRMGHESRIEKQHGVSIGWFNLLLYNQPQGPKQCACLQRMSLYPFYFETPKLL